MRAWKERGLRHLATLAAELVSARIERPAVDVITYIPPDPVRQLERARHPAQALAHELAARWGLDCELLLERARSTGRQAALPRSARRANVHDVFVAKQHAYRRVLVVDDIYTTGATLSAAATELRRDHDARVEAVTFARALR